MAGYWWGCGAQPADVNASTPSNYTVIPDGGAVPTAGKITKIQIYANNAGVAKDYEFAVFSKSGNDFTDKYSITISGVTEGYQEYVDPTDFSKDNLPVAIGDWIGFYAHDNGRIERDTTTGPGDWYDSGDQIGDAGASTFTEETDTYEVQLRVWIETEAGQVEALSGTISAQSSLGGDIYRTRKISGQVQSSAQFDGVMGRMRGILGTIQAQAGFSSNLKIARGLGGSIDSQASFVGALKRGRGLHGEIAGQASFLSSLKRTRGLYSTITGQATFIGELLVPGIVSLDGLIEGISAFSAELKRGRKISGTISGQATFDAILGELERIKSLSGLIDAQSSFVGSLKRDRGLSGLIEGQADLSALLNGILALSGSIDAVSTLSTPAPRTIYKTIMENIGIVDKSLRSKKTYDGGEDNINRILSNIWDEVDKISTVWKETKTIEKKDE